MTLDDIARHLPPGRALVVEHSAQAGDCRDGQVVWAVTVVDVASGAEVWHTNALEFAYALERAADDGRRRVVGADVVYGDEPTVEPSVGAGRVAHAAMGRIGNSLGG